MAEAANDSESGPELVQITLGVTKTLLERYDKLVEFGCYASRDEAMRHGLLDSMRFALGSYHNIRLDAEHRVAPEGETEIDEDGTDKSGEQSPER